MSFLCTTKNGNNEKMYFKLIRNTNKIEVKIIDKDDKLLSKEIINYHQFKGIYEPLINEQLNHNFRFEFWENL